MPANPPTWTAERLELLKSRFEAGLTCRQIADDIGVSRNAVIGKLSRLNLTRDGEVRPPPRKRAAKGQHPKTGPRLQYQMLKALYGEPQPAADDADPQRTLLLVARVERAEMPLADQHARALRISVFAATRRCKACPIARATPGSPIGRAPASASCADKAQRVN